MLGSHTSAWQMRHAIGLRQAQGTVREEDYCAKTTNRVLHCTAWPFVLQLSLDLSTSLEIVEMLRASVEDHVKGNPTDFSGASSGENAAAACSCHCRRLPGAGSGMGKKGFQRLSARALVSGREGRGEHTKQKWAGMRCLGSAPRSAGLLCDRQTSRVLDFSHAY